MRTRSLTWCPVAVVLALGGCDTTLAADPDAVVPDAAAQDSPPPDAAMPDAVFPIADLADQHAWVEMPGAQGVVLKAVWGSGPNDVFAVGAQGTILHYDGATWKPMTSGANADLEGVWGSGPQDVFVVGAEGMVLHYDGTSWSSMPSTTGNSLEALWGSSAQDVFAVGLGGTIVHYDGAGWSTMLSGTSEPLEAVWGSGPQHVVAVGGDPGSGLGTIFALRFDGTGWKQMEPGIKCGPYCALFGVWGRSATDLYVVGMGNRPKVMNERQAVVFHHDGTSWHEMTSPFGCVTATNFCPLEGVWGSGSDIYAVGVTALPGFPPVGRIARYADTGFMGTTDLSGAQPHAVWGSGPEDVFVVGDNTILHYGAK